MDPQLQQLIAGLRAGRPDFTAPPAEARANFETLLATLPVAEDIAFERVELGGVSGLRATTPNAARDGALLYLHGGAYIGGSAQGYRGLAAELGRASGSIAYAMDYRLAPEHRFPAAVDDAVAAYTALLERFDPKHLAIAGDSAGGGLTLAALVALRDRGVALPACAVLISPWADLACEGESIASKADEDPALTAAGLKASAKHYVGDANPRAPLASPIHADLASLPPILVQVGSAEILLDDAVRIARQAGVYGVEARLEIWPDMIHVWHAFAFMLPAGRAAIDRAGEFVRARTGD